MRTGGEQETRVDLGEDELCYVAYIWAYCMSHGTITKPCVCIVVVESCEKNEQLRSIYIASHVHISDLKGALRVCGNKQNTFRIHPTPYTRNVSSHGAR